MPLVERKTHAQVVALNVWKCKVWTTNLYLNDWRAKAIMEEKIESRLRWRGDSARKMEGLQVTLRELDERKALRVR